MDSYDFEYKIMVYKKKRVDWMTDEPYNTYFMSQVAAGKRGLVISTPAKPGEMDPLAKYVNDNRFYRGSKQHEAKLVNGVCEFEDIGGCEPVSDKEFAKLEELLGWE